MNRFIFPGFLEMRSIKFKLSALFVFQILLPFLLLTLACVYYSQSILKERIIVTHKEITKQIGQNLNVVFRDMVTTTQVVLANNDMEEVLSTNIYDDPVNIFANIKMLNNIFTEMMYSVLTYPNSFVAIKDSYGNLHLNMPLSVIKDKVASFIDSSINPDAALLSKWLLVEGLNLGNETYSVGLLKVLPYEALGRSKGVILVSVNEVNFYHVMRSAKIEAGITLRMVDADGRIISSTTRDEVDQPYPNYSTLSFAAADEVSSIYHQSGKEFVNSYTLINGWTLVETIPREVIYRDIDRIRTLFILIGGGFLLLFISISVFLVGRFTKPIILLTDAMKEVQRGNMNVSVKINGRDEVGQLSKAFNTMMLRMDELIQRINEEQRDKREAELKMLRSQIKPHFLFNTLNSIRWVADMNKAKPVSDLIVSLATLLKNGILGNKEIVPLSEELENLKHYCNIQAIRYGGLFEVDYRVQPDALSCPVIHLILQPIIENSLIHGFEGLNRKGCITVEGWTEDEKLTIRIADNGKGMSQDTLASIFKPERERPAAATTGGIGLSNVQDRLRIHYGDNCDMTIDSEVGQGTTVTLTFPIHAAASDRSEAHD